MTRSLVRTPTFIVFWCSMAVCVVPYITGLFIFQYFQSKVPYITDDRFYPVVPIRRKVETCDENCLRLTGGPMFYRWISRFSILEESLSSSTSLLMIPVTVYGYDPFIVLKMCLPLSSPYLSYEQSSLVFRVVSLFDRKNSGISL